MKSFKVDKKRYIIQENGHKRNRGYPIYKKGGMAAVI